ncbi:MAG TPA: sialidase family protein, partial [Gemmatimonadales bacterium]
GLVKITYPSGQWINISPNLDTSLALRKVGNQPIQWSATNPRELLVGFNHLMATTDGGMHWKKLSPDLGYPKGVTPPARTVAAGRGGRGAGGGAGAPVGGSIESISSSSLAPGMIWVGTNNGLVKLTRNHGVTWEDVTVPDLPNPTRADISTVEASRHNPGEAYLAIDYHTSADYRPYFYRTRDYGKTWTKIVTGLPTDQPSGSFARVIREDTRKPGLLFAGTESSMYVSFDDGDNWEDLSLNLPNTSFRDLVIKDNDLVAGTYGRGIWILDDISPLRQLTPAIAAEPAHLFKPGDAIRVRRNVNGDTPFPPEVPHAENPPVGAIVYYYLSNAAPTVTIDVTDAAGKAVRHFSSAPFPARTEPPPPVPDFWLERPEPLPAGAGMHRINWNLRYDDPPAFNHNYEINANPGGTPASPEGPLVLPGVYTVTLTVEGKSYPQTVTVRNDPRSPATAADLALQHAAQMALDHGAETAWTGYQQVTAARTAVADVLHENPEPDVVDAARSLDSALARVGGTRSAGGRGGGGGRGAGGPPAAPNFATLVGTMTRQLGTLDPGDMAPNDVTRAALDDACHDLRAAVAAWNGIVAGELPAFNGILTKHNRKPVAVPRTLTAAGCAPMVAAPGRR